ncbi:DUF4282 domain-containing protein [Pseudoalteromonas sp. A3]|uniref:DUF4282 domain-containing protein n=1 Tax=unclassified Pseudoalteromonas TaxID=194690 RepID=UPI0020C04A05|nr:MULTISPECIES: DUF4282 domain-containing protein [unclassified Pseudoalteromonas]MCK8095945.1 DUF4282 domain-containing protein [Pseudoalteromonas sp. 1CM17D]MCW1720211.1 DUF4282 domain-containing protein [Pseudoalteromonas sp. A3]
MKDVLFFDSMLTPKIITFVYWLLLIAAAFSGLTTIFGGYGGVTFFKFISGLFVAGFGALAARISCELTIVLFKINENLKQISDNSAE